MDHQVAWCFKCQQFRPRGSWGFTCRSRVRHWWRRVFVAECRRYYAKES